MRHIRAAAQALALALLLSVSGFGQAKPTRLQNTHKTPPTQAETLPTEDEINSLVTQAERAFLIYESTLSGSNVSTPNDQTLMAGAKEIIKNIKRNPQYFNAPMGFLLVSDLDDASRNMALCAFQVQGLASVEVVVNHGSDAALKSADSKIQAAQSFIDTSTLLQTVGETAFNLYVRYLSANFQGQQAQAEGLQECMDTLQKCADALKRK